MLNGLIEEAPRHGHCGNPIRLDQFRGTWQSDRRSPRKTKTTDERMSKIFKSLFCAGVAAVPLSYVTCGHAVSGLGDQDWRTLAVADFGTRVQYPAGIFSAPNGKPEKGVGERLSTDDGRATLSVYSRVNEGGDTPASYLNNYLRTPRTQLDYQRVTPSFFAISAVKDDTIYYSRCNFSRSAIHCFDLVYPEREKRAWDAIVTRISLSLRPLQR